MSKAPLDIDAVLAKAEAKPDGAPARLLDAALEEFAAGVAAARTQAIATRAGVSVGSLHFHWRDKHTLYEAVCRRSSRRYGQMLASALAEAAVGGLPDPEKLIDTWLEASVDLFVEQPSLVKLLLHRFADDEPLADRETHVGDLRLMEQAMGAIFPRVASGEVDGPMTILFVYFASLVLFSGSDVQSAYLGLETGDPAFRKRFVAHSGTMLRRLLL